MEINNNERVFAYKLAKTIANDDLEKISGGSGVQMSVQNTTKATGGSSAGVDALYDISVDW